MVEVEEVAAAMGLGGGGQSGGQGSAAVGVEALDVMVLATAECAGGRLCYGGGLCARRPVRRCLLVEIGEGVGGERTQVLTVTWRQGITHTHTQRTVT